MTYGIRSIRVGLLNKVFKTSDVAKICGVHLRTVIRWIERGELTAYKLPGRGDNRITEENLVAFLKKNGLPVPAELKQHERVLIIDDDPSMSTTLQLVIQRSGYETAIAHDGFQAGRLLTGFKPTLITLDLKMPGMNGFNVIEFIRQQEDLASIKILIISALDESELIQAVEIGADAYLQKPFKNKILLEHINNLIRN